MKISRFRWTTYLVPFLALLTLPLVAGACAKEEKPTITFHDGQWESLWIGNAIAEFIIENAYGYPVEQVVENTPVWQASIESNKGEVHVNLEMWQQNILDWYNEQVSAGKLENLGMTFEGGPQFWMIPQWVHEEYGINTIEDMKTHWELFKDPEDPSKGYFIQCMTGWRCAQINTIKLEAYGLDEYYNNIIPGTAAALDAALAGAQKKRKPIFGYYWAPTAIMGMYDWYILEEPPFTQECWAKIQQALEEKIPRPIDEACAYETNPIDKGIWPGLRDIAPDVVELLEKMNIGLEPINKTAAYMQQNKFQDYEKAAIYYLRNFEDRWTTWMPDDKVKKVKDALAKM